MHTRPAKHTHQLGFTLAEVLVASAIFTVIIIAALLVYDRSNQVFKQSAESVDLQQNSRVSFNKVVADVRMAGFDYDRDGIPTGVTPMTWSATTVYAVGDVVVPTVSNGSQYFCTIGGTSSGSQPTWPSSGTVTDGTVTWQQSSGVAVFQQPDEQIEYAGQTALTIRGNFDYDANEAADRFNGRETDLESRSPWFPVITTGNDEIVTYALSKPSIVGAGSNSTGSAGCSKTSTNCVHFFADVNNGGTQATRTAYPGGSAERAIDIGKVDLTNSAPPYTLYRITLSESGDAVYTPVADNIRSLRFKYYEDTSGSTTLKDLATTPADVSNGVGGDGPYDPNNSTAVIADRLIRAKIKSIQVELIGMNPNPDKNYVDPNASWTGSTDTVSPNTRKVTLSTLVVPRNLGKRGQRIQAIQAPNAPAITKVCTGYCNLVQITWAAPSGGGVTGYNILYDTASNGSFQSLQSTGLVTTAYCCNNMTPNVPYYFKIQALNDYGSGTSPAFAIPANGTPIAFTPINATTPQNPTSVAATTNVQNEIDVTWQRPVNYSNSANTITCTPGGAMSPAPPIPSQDPIQYNVWRSLSTPVNTGSTPYISYSTGGSNAPNTNVATGQVTFQDKSVANCTSYYYAVQAVKPVCEPNVAYYTQVPHSGSVEVAAAGQSNSTTNAPAAVADLQVRNAVCGANYCNVSLQWPRVTTDIATPTPKTIVVDTYEITRTQKLLGVVTTAASNPNSTGGSNLPYVGTVSRTVNGWSVNPATNVSVVDTVPQTDAGGTDYTYEYKVRAYQCTLPGGYSPTRTYPCTFDSAATPLTVTISPSFQGNGTSLNPYYFDAPATITATATANVQSAHGFLYSWDSATSTFVNPVDLGTNTGPFTSTTFPVPASMVSVGTRYRAEVIFTDTAGCTSRVRAEGIMEASNCCLKQLADDPLQPSSSATTGVIRGFTAGTSTSIDVFFENICTSDLVVQPNGIVMVWSNSALSGSPAPKISSIEFPTQASSGSGVGTCSFDSSIKCYTYNISPNGGSGTYTAPTTSSGTTQASNVLAGTTTYRVRYTFTKALSQQPISSVQMLYRRATDISTVTCGVIP